MAEIKCPQCGTLISLEQSDLDSIVRQVRDEEFRREVAERMELLAVEKDQAVELAVQKVQADAAQHLADARAEAAERLTAAEGALLEQKASEAERVSAMEARMAQMEAEKSAEIEQLKAQIANSDALARADKDLAVTKAVAALEKERDALTASLDLQKAEQARSEEALKGQMVQQLNAKEAVIAYQQEEIQRIKEMKARLTTKLIGESLEQHCQYEFDRIRASAFPHAYFEKDNTVADGTKGDFIFREADEDGNEVISIMFEMKNEEDGTIARKRNEDHLAKLDRDRTKKGCEYAVLVSLLEPESELYNEGIVDVSHRYPKMYVIRPQFFIPLISLLRNAALNSLHYKRELALSRQQEMDITTFEQDLETFKAGFFKNFTDASLRFEDTIKAIDKAIKDLQTARDKLMVSEKHLNAANNKLEGLTVKKLTRKNPTMKAKFAALKEAGDEKGEDAATAEE